VAALAGSGCVRREIEILSEPPGATVQFDAVVLPRKTPVRFPFTWYGSHEVVVELEGYHRERLIAHVRPPWYEHFPLDFFAEHLWPWTLNDIHTFPFQLEKRESLRHATKSEKEALKHGLLERAEEFRKEAKEKLSPLPKK